MHQEVRNPLRACSCFFGMLRRLDLGVPLYTGPIRPQNLLTAVCLRSRMHSLASSVSRMYLSIPAHAFVVVADS